MEDLVNDIPTGSTPEKTPRKRRSLFRRILRIFRNVFFIGIALFLALAVLLQFPFVQTWLGKQATGFLQDKFDVQVTIHSVNIRLPNSVKLGGVLVMDHRNDTLLYAEALQVKIKALKFGAGLISMEKISLEDGYFNMVNYQGDEKNNLSLLIDKFKPKKEAEPKKPGKRMVIASETIKLTNIRLNIVNQNSTPPPARFESNNIRLTSINGLIRNFQVASDSISFETIGLEGVEKSGLVMKQLDAQVLICNKKLSFTAMDLLTNHSRLSGYYAMEYNEFKSFSDFLNQVHLKADLSISNIDMKDIAYFATSLEGIDFDFRFRGKVSGPVSHLVGSDIRIYFGTVSQFNGKIDMKGLPNIDSTYIKFDLEKLATDAYDLQTIPVPPFSEGKKLKMPAEVIRMGVLNFSGNFQGLISDFKANGYLATNAGNAITNMNVKQDKATGKLQFLGKAELDQFNIGKVIAKENILGKVSMVSDTLTGTIKDGKINGLFQGMITSADINGYQYRNIKAKLNYSNDSIRGALDLDDPNVWLDFDGSVDFSKKERLAFDFTADIRNLNLNKLNLYPSDTTRIISANLDLNFSGLTPDEILGSIEIKNLEYKQGAEKLMMNSLQLTAMLVDTGKSFVVKSDFVNADFNGRFRFSSLFNEIKDRLNDVLPLLAFKVDENYQKDTNDFKYKIKFTDVNPVTRLFLPALAVGSGTYIEGNYSNVTDKVNIDCYIPFLSYNNIVLDRINFSADNKDGYFNFHTIGNSLSITDSLHLDNLELQTKARGDTVFLDFGFLNNGPVKNGAEIRATSYLGNQGNYKINLYKSSFYFNDSLWVLGDADRIEIDTNRVFIQDVAIYRGNSSTKILALDGEISRNPNRPLRLGLFEFPLEFFNSFLKDSDTELHGIADGTVEVYDVFANPYFLSDLDISNLAVDDLALGDLKIGTRYFPEQKEVVLNTKLVYEKNEVLNVTDAKFYPYNETNQFDVKAEINGLPFKIAEKFTGENLTDLGGKLFGRFTLTGALKDPKFKLNIRGQELAMKVGYTKTAYKVQFPENEFIRVNNTSILLPDLEIYDEKDGFALIKGSIQHQMFKDIKLNIVIDELNNFTALNTSRKDNSQFYGKAIVSNYAGKDLKISGPFTDLKIRGAVKTEAGTVVNIPLDNASKTSAASFVTFINKQLDTLSIISDAEAKESNVKFDVQIAAIVSESAEFRLIFDEVLGDVITARGDGEFDIFMNSEGRFDLFGTYTIASGDYLFTLQGFANKKFNVKPGSNITWTGNVAKAKLDVTAIYTSSASIKEIMASLDPINAEQYRGREKVNCELSMRGSLDAPTIDFGLDLPNTDENVKNLLLSALNTQEEKQRQVFSLLILSQFLPPESLYGGSGGGGNVVGGLTGTPFELITNQLNDWIGKVNSDFNIKLDYTQAASSSQQDQVVVGGNYALLNNRIVIDADLGVSNQGASSNVSSVVGNVTVDFKITKDGKLRAKAFNRSNENNLLKNSIPYTQGLSISYRREFDFWSELRKKRVPKKQKTTVKDTVKSPVFNRDSILREVYPDSSLSPDTVPVNRSGENKESREEPQPDPGTDPVVTPKKDNGIKEEENTVPEGND